MKKLILSTLFLTLPMVAGPQQDLVAKVKSGQLTIQEAKQTELGKRLLKGPASHSFTKQLNKLKKISEQTEAKRKAAQVAKANAIALEQAKRAEAQRKAQEEADLKAATKASLKTAKEEAAKRKADKKAEDARNTAAANTSSAISSRSKNIPIELEDFLDLPVAPTTTSKEKASTSKTEENRTAISKEELEALNELEAQAKAYDALNEDAQELVTNNTVKFAEKSKILKPTMKNKSSKLKTAAKWGIGITVAGLGVLAALSNGDKIANLFSKSEN